MKTKLVWAITFLLLLVAFCLFIPLYYQWHQEYFELSDQEMFMPFIGMSIVLIALFGGLIVCLSSHE